MIDFDGKLQIERDREDFYILEINDKGDYVEFDLTDIGLAEKILKASENIFRIDAECKKGKTDIYEMYKDEKERLVQETINLENKKSDETAKEMDSFLGEGTCKKIFGDKKNIGQYLMLLDALEPHFAKMEIKIDKAKRKLVQKYMVDDKGTL